MERRYIDRSEMSEQDPVVKAVMRLDGITAEAAITRLKAEDDATEYWVNDLYQVAKMRLAPIVGGIFKDDEASPGWYHLNIRRRDGGPILRDWRHFQQIKNELIGPDCEGFEMYPAESRKVDENNKYHIFVCGDPAFRFPFGWRERSVSFDEGETRGMRQRRLEPKLQGVVDWKEDHHG
jgi:hypothetical protein